MKNNIIGILICSVLLFGNGCDVIKNTSNFFSVDISQKVDGVWKSSEFFKDSRTGKRRVFYIVEKALQLNDPYRNRECYIEFNWKTKAARLKFEGDLKVYNLKLIENDSNSFYIEYPSGIKRKAYFKREPHNKNYLFFEYDSLTLEELDGQKVEFITSLQSITQLAQKGKRAVRTVEEAQYDWDIRRLIEKIDKTSEDEKKIKEYEDEYGL